MMRQISLSLVMLNIYSNYIYKNERITNTTQKHQKNVSNIQKSCT